VDVTGSLTSFEAGALRQAITGLVAIKKKDIVLIWLGSITWTVPDRRTRSKLPDGDQERRNHEGGRSFFEGGGNSENHAALQVFRNFQMNKPH